MNEPTGVAADAATILFNLPDYSVISTSLRSDGTLVDVLGGWGELDSDRRQDFADVNIPGQHPSEAIDFVNDDEVDAGCSCQRSDRA